MVLLHLESEYVCTPLFHSEYPTLGPQMLKY